MSGKSKKSANQLAGQLPGGAAAPGAAVAPCKKNKDPQLKVRVWGLLDGKKRYVQASVKANALAQPAAAKTGVADFSYVVPGTYQISVAAVSAPDDRDFFAVAGTLATVTLGKRISRDFYVAYERSLAGTLGTFSIFYDLSRRFTLRARTGEQSAIDLIFTVPYD